MHKRRKHSIGLERSGVASATASLHAIAIGASVKADGEFLAQSIRNAAVTGLDKRVHASHHCGYHRGLTWCWRCGSLSTGARYMMLTHACPGAIPPAPTGATRLSNLVRLRDGSLPHGVATWPADRTWHDIDRADVSHLSADEDAPAQAAHGSPAEGHTGKRLAREPTVTCAMAQSAPTRSRLLESSSPTCTNAPRLRMPPTAAFHASVCA